MRVVSGAIVAGLLGVAVAVLADVPIERPGQVARLTPARAHQVVVSDFVLRRSGLVDLDSGAFLGMFNTGYLSSGGVFPSDGRAFYVPETFYSRGTRGERTDVVTIYDHATLSPIGEVVIPPKLAKNVLPTGNSALLDDGRFVVALNMTPGTSVSVVDVEKRTFVGEIATPGCALVYPAGPRSFFSLCADGALLGVTLDEDGRKTSVERSAPFFDPEADPITEKGVRIGDTWIFASFEGIAHPIDVSGPFPEPGAPWPLIGDADRADAWRVGGSQHLAAHAGLNRLYSLVHQGGVDTQKSPGTELWVYDLARRERVARIDLVHPGLELLGEPLTFGETWPWPFSRIPDFLLDNIVPDPGIAHVAVTQGDAPLLVTGSSFGGSLAVYDAESGEFLRRIATGNFTVQRLQAPWVAP